jgi:SPP1 gp7 family putative phage head morphogenesis protein
MDTQISRVLAQGIADGDNPILLARKMRGVIAGAGTGELGITDTLGRFIPAKRRAEMIARTEVIRAHHQATIQEYENWAMEGVIVKAEFKTAGGTACDQCKSLEGKIFSLQEIRNLIPVHPNCFLDPNTPVYTEGGYKRIANIKKGELVLTHKKRFRPVTAAIKTNVDECEVVSIKFKNTYLTMTADHPVMKNSEWIPVGDCFEGDLVTTMEYYFEDYELISWPIEVMKKYFMETPQTLYNLSVDEDESFVAKGLVVHNCRCVALPKIVE